METDHIPAYIGSAPMLPVTNDMRDRVLREAGLSDWEHPLGRATHDAVAYLLNIQDIAPLEDMLAVAGAALRPSGRLAIV